METVAHVVSSPEPAVTDNTPSSVVDNNSNDGECVVFMTSVVL